MSLKDEFIKEAVGDLFGKAPASEPKTESSVMDEFVQQGVKDLYPNGGAPVQVPAAVSTSNKENAKKLEEAFAKSAETTNAPAEEQVKEELIDKFTKDAENESKDVLSKLLKGIR